MSKKAWIIFSVIVVVILGGLVLYSRSVNPPVDVSKIDTNAIQAASEQNGEIADHVLGSQDGKVTLIEYGDFQCPYCGQAYAPLKKVTDKYGDKISFVFRNFPLTTQHPNARAAAATAEAAALQDKYWEMHDALYGSQTTWSSANDADRTAAFSDLAKQIGLDMDKYNAALANGAKQVNKKIAFDQAIGKKLGVNSTPSYYLNGVKVSEDVGAAIQRGDTSGLEDLINAELKKAGIDLPEDK